MREVSKAAALLRATGVTQHELGHALGRSQRSVSFYLSGDRRLPRGFRATLEALTSRGKAKSIVEAIPNG